MSKFAQEIEPVAVPEHVKDDLDAPYTKEIHSCRLPLESCKAGPRLPTVMIS